MEIQRPFCFRTTEFIKHPQEKMMEVPGREMRALARVMVAAISTITLVFEWGRPAISPTGGVNVNFLQKILEKTV